MYKTIIIRGWQLLLYIYNKVRRKDYTMRRLPYILIECNFSLRQEAAIDGILAHTLCAGVRCLSSKFHIPGNYLQHQRLPLARTCNNHCNNNIL